MDKGSKSVALDADNDKRKRSQSDKSSHRGRKRFREAVKRVIHIQRNIRHLFDERISRLIQERQATSHNAHNERHVTIIDKIPITGGYDNVLFDLSIGRTLRPPLIIKYYFPDIYNMILKEPHHKTYINYKKIVWITTQIKCVNKLNDKQKAVLKMWTGKFVYKIIARLLRLLFNRPCSNKLANITMEYQFDVYINEIIEQIISNQLFTDYIKEANVSRLSKKAFLKNNMYLLKFIVISYIEDVYDIMQAVQDAVMNELGEDFFDDSEIYVFRGQDDIYHTHCEDTYLDCPFSTSLRFNVASNFIKPVNNEPHKMPTKKHGDIIKNNLYIYKLTKQSKAIYIEPVSHFLGEYEVLMFPPDRDTFISTLQQYIDKDVVTMLDEMKIHKDMKKNRSISSSSVDSSSNADEDSEDNVLDTWMESTSGGDKKQTLTINELKSISVSNHTVKLETDTTKFIIKVCEMY